MNKRALKKTILKTVLMVACAAVSAGSGVALAVLLEYGHARIVVAIIIGIVLGSIGVISVNLYRIESGREEANDDQ